MFDVLAKKLENHDLYGQSLAKEHIHFALNSAGLITWTELLRTKEHSTMNHHLFKLHLNPFKIFTSSSGFMHGIIQRNISKHSKKGDGDIRPLG
jgi:hypothetical protein